MHIGTALQAPNGLGPLACDATYHLLGNRSDTDFTWLVWFCQEPNGWKAHFTQLTRTQFEDALCAGDLKPTLSQSTLPPWLSAYEGETLEGLEDGRNSNKKSYRARAEDRYEQIAELVDPSSAIHRDEDPGAFITRYAKSSSPKRHPDRLKLWFSAYMCFGQGLMALIAPFRNAGRWERAAHPSASKKLGRPSKRKGKKHGHSAIPLANEIERAYIRYAGLGVTMAAIHRKSLIHIFGCLTRRSDKGNEEYYHPTGKPFPTYQQFRYWVVQRQGLPAVQRSKLGDANYRSKIAASEGRFSQSVANLYEKTEMDCYQLKELPKKLLSDDAGPPLIVARMACVVSGHQLGIGFSYGSEKEEAYRSMHFCAAVPKPYFGRLFGLTITEDEWPSQGLPPSSTADRGPGASPRVFAHGNAAPPIRDIAPSYSGQSKATIESSHPRGVQLQGQPSHVLSKLNAFELAQREVRRVLIDNETKDASSRLTPEMIAAGVLPTPNAIFKYLDARGRTSAIPMAIETAVRTFLNPAVFKLNRDGLWLQDLRYDSPAVRETGLHSKAAAGSTIELSGFVFPMAVRIAWIEINRKLYEVEAMLPIRDDDSQLYMSLTDLAASSAALRDLRTDRRDHASATRAKHEIAHLDETGSEWDASIRKAGHARSKATRREQVPTATPVRGRKSA